MAKKKAKENRKLVWVEVDSSQIEAVAYKGEVLYMRFNSGAVYSYDPVDEEAYNGLLNAESVGSYFSKYIKSDKTIKVEKIS